jgi:hypothetical protein
MRPSTAKQLHRVVLAGLSILFLASTVHAVQDPIVFPANNQSNEQTESDKYACYSWAKGQTGFDPMEVPTATAPPPEQKGGVVKGAAKGALLGVAVGAVAGDAKKGAGIGAASGGIIGGARKHQSEKAQEQYQQEQVAGYEQRRSEYNRAWGACMEGKGYTVK